MLCRWRAREGFFPVVPAEDLDGLLAKEHEALGHPGYETLWTHVRCRGGGGWCRVPSQQAERIFQGALPPCMGGGRPVRSAGVCGRCLPQSLQAANANAFSASHATWC